MHRQLRQEIAQHFARDKGQLDDRSRELVQALIELLDAGMMRAANRLSDGRWEADVTVKQGILLGFRVGVVIEVASAPFQLSDKDTFPLRRLDVVEQNVRIVPGGSSIREGAFVGRNVTCMPPMYVNVGAYVDDDTMIDSHVLVGSCAQIGKRVHLSAGVQIGGVLEPIGQVPVVIEDDVLIGGNCGIYEGTVVRTKAVIGSGTILNASTRVFDLVSERILSAGPDGGLEIPEGAVVVPGSRPASGAFAEAHGLQLYTPVIVKYRDEKTDLRAALEGDLR